ncbi:hypothetical protein CKO41_15940 [Thiococcus pfennigii]|nr:hypothetical protein [Thiococcus pfennigii]MBK1733242.1 hypothetical protein [Thiococcus pfennigii]
MPGVGKTFLLKRLRRLGGSVAPFLGYKERVGALKFRYRWSRYQLGFITDLLPDAIARRALRGGYQYRARELETRALIDFVESHQDLAVWLIGAVDAADAAARDKVLVLSWFHRLFADYRLATDSKDSGRCRHRFLMFDEGFAQKAVSLALHLNFTPAMVGEYATHMPSPDLLIVIDAPDEVIFQRLEQRGWPSWVAPTDEEGKRRFMVCCRDAVLAMVDALAARGVSVVTVSNEGSGESVAKRMASLLSAHQG